MKQFDHVMSIHPEFEPVAANYNQLGFNLTDVTHHPTGTGNRLVIFRSNFLELLATTRPEKMNDRSRGMVDAYLQHRTGVSGIAFVSEDQTRDYEEFEANGVPNLMKHDFQRPVTLPDGSQGVADVEVVFSRKMETPLVFFFTSHQKRPEAIWQPAWQKHANGATDILEVVSVESSDQAHLANYQTAVLGAENTSRENGTTTGRVANGYSLSVSTPTRLQERYAWAGLRCEDHAAYSAGLVIRCENLEFVRQAVAEHAIPATCRDRDILVDPEWTGGTFLHLVG